MTTTEQVPDAVPAPTDITITAMEPEEYPLLAEFLYQAIHVPPGTPTPDRSVVELPELRRYIEDSDGSATPAWLPRSKLRIGR